MLFSTKQSTTTTKYLQVNEATEYARQVIDQSGESDQSDQSAEETGPAVPDIGRRYAREYHL